MMGQELFDGANVRLAPLLDTDADDIANWHMDVEFLRQFSSEAAYPKDPDQLVSQIGRWRKSPNQYMFGIRRQDDDQLVGFCGFDDISWRNRLGWIAIALDPEEWGNGYGKEAMQLLLRYGFEELGLRKAQLTVFEYNARALALYRSLNFQTEGAFREICFRDGRYYDMIAMGLLDREWRQE